MKRLTGVRACLFDAYGTIFDFASAANGCPDVPPLQRAALTALWRDKQLQYTWLRTLQGRYADFWQVTSEALDFALEALNIQGTDLHARLMGLYLELAAFPEVPGVLAEVREAGFVTAILSNGTPAMLAAAVANANLAGLFDAVLSVDAVQVFKTHPSAYRYAVEQLGVPASAISFQSSNAWDAHAAADFGMQVVWCNRYGQPRDRLPGGPDCEIVSLADLPEILGVAV